MYFYWYDGNESSETSRRDRGGDNFTSVDDMRIVMNVYLASHRYNNGLYLNRIMIKKQFPGIIEINTSRAVMGRKHITSTY